MNAKQKLHQATIHKYNYWKHLLKEEVVDSMLPDIVPLSPSASLQLSDPYMATGITTEQLPAVNPNRANCANRAIRETYTNTNVNVRFCVDGVSFALEPSIRKDFLRTLIRAVHYA